mgnify:CR=1 FL=1
MTDRFISIEGVTKRFPAPGGGATTVFENLWLSMAVIALLILATTTGIVGIGSAVFVHEGSTLLVVGNALRLLRYEFVVTGADRP